MMKTYGQYWRHARMKSGISQGELGGLLGLGSSQFISNVERGIGRYSLAMTAKLITILELDPEKVISLILREEKARIRKGMGL